jgi:hypothetical protein
MINTGKAVAMRFFRGVDMLCHAVLTSYSFQRAYCLCTHPCTHTRTQLSHSRVNSVIYHWEPFSPDRHCRPLQMCSPTSLPIPICNYIPSRALHRRHHKTHIPPHSLHTSVCYSVLQEVITLCLLHNSACVLGTCQCWIRGTFLYLPMW